MWKEVNIPSTISAQNISWVLLQVFANTGNLNLRIFLNFSGWRWGGRDRNGYSSE